MTQAPPGRYLTREALTPGDITRAQALRTQCFQTGTVDRDAFDAAARHFLIEDRDSGTLVCCFRLTRFHGAELAQSYAAQFYELSRLERMKGAMLELGRFCIHPEWQDPDIQRLAWGQLAREVDDSGAALLFGCSSFTGTDPTRYRDAFALLKQQHLAPAEWRPRVRAAEVHPYARDRHSPDPRRARQQIPPLLRSYLAMGGWVSDHAVIDRQMGTLHVFTALEIAAIPPNRARLLRALA
ncbi:GNAT family N-acetyltransferase [Sulfitobacter sp. KE29]|uniref:GNAT family N-acetyltransferase n=1 Tax=Sulfitobacter TaxID=60136 RepID=UPI0007C1FE2F|nr:MULTISPECIES: GNAT family N-acetyltransferase [Sulfitobacter]KZY51085.1 ornithine-acyl-ACP acyltransferase [Sulfitobacter sp. HI0054]MBO9437639.1 GNAT family N-acetyltransferase [Sulfitobacter sp. R18_2]MDF3417178.1 GNAT family N-acetyltransferase [Sulfitobacter sp. Ks38]MDF3424660.1 GNAT family N-acetyltransferase [Sulfitobacter sp. KE29]MDF3428240.1 GNAT family N-acetyltransferase [Sulfitobacter sp. S46]